MDAATKSAVLRLALEVENTGNQFYQEARYVEAESMYAEAIIKLQQIDDKMCSHILASCYQKRAAAYERMEMFDEAAVNATKAIELNPSYAMAYFRRAKANVGLKKWYCALQDGLMACILEKFRNINYTRFAAKINARFGEFFVTNNLYKNCCKLFIRISSK